MRSPTAIAGYETTLLPDFCANRDVNIQQRVVINVPTQPATNERIGIDLVQGGAQCEHRPLDGRDQNDANPKEFIPKNCCDALHDGKLSILYEQFCLESYAMADAACCDQIHEIHHFIWD